ncbi:hypothetical protein DUI87_13681 [Hirundo rustica rustica]|uniref:ribonuclease H n=1 Tax=Hirundo rustica rustica TaxID=333673 RepID=A0A3M0K8N8_HIRRU|nr:hypothetical protein DUI87_13681 [Hirundo rustica rustica]
MLELQYELESKAAKWYATIDIANAFFSIPLAAECRPQFAFTWRGVQYTWNRLPQGWKHSPTICHGLIQAALEKGAIGFWRMHIPEYSQIVSPLYLVTCKKNDFHWGPEQQQAFAQIKQEIAHAVALGPVRTGPEVKNVLYSAARNNGLSWSLWQKVPGETRGRPLGFWSRSYRGSEANYTPTEKEILAAYEGVQAASEVAQATEGEGGSSQLAELKAFQLALDIAEREKWPKLYLYTDSWMVANALWGWLEKWKKANWQRRGKPIWAADEWKDIATRVEKLPVKVRHVDAHVPKSRANEEHQNNEQDNIEVVNEEIKIKLCPLRVEDEEKINSEVWYTPDSVGRLNIPPFSVIIKDPETLIRVKQYPISPEGKNGLKPEIERLLSKGLLESCMSPFNTPILPIKKADGSYRLVHDLREINKRTVARFPVVANPYTLLSRLGPEKQYYSVIDLKDAFWACPLDEKSRDYFAFEWEDPVTHRRQQLRWTVLPQGFTESPNLFGQALEQILQEYQTGEGVTLIQYVDDLLIAGETEDKVRAESIRLLNFLSAKGLKVSKAKLQFVEEEVKYLRHYLRKGEKKIDPERVKGILSIPPPKSKKQIRQLLGLMGYCRQWIENYSTKVKFLYEKLSQGGLVK